jgi:hypothetical protein
VSPSNFHVAISGIAINKDGIAYFADGANIRTVDGAATIETIIGNQEQPGEWKPMPCHKAVTFEKVGFSDTRGRPCALFLPRGRPAPFFFFLIYW